MRTEAEELPFEDESFDLVFGHAVLHHIPDLDKAFAEFRRVLRPGGAIAFAGEPSRYGDRLAALPKRAGLLAAPAWRRADRRPAARRRRGRAVATATRSRARSTSTPSPPPTCAACCATPASRTATSAARSCSPTPGAGACARSSRAPSPTRSPGAGAASPSAATSPCRRSTPALLEPHLPAELFYNLLVSGPQAGLVVSRSAAGAEELDAGVDPLEPALAGEGVGEGVAGGLLRRRVDQDAAGPGDAGDAARQVDRAAVVVARLGERRAAGEAGAQERGTPRLLPRPPRSAAAPRPASPRPRSRRASPRRRSSSPGAPAARPRSLAISSKRPATEPSSSGAISSPSRVNSTRSAKQTERSTAPRISPEARSAAPITSRRICSSSVRPQRVEQRRLEERQHVLGGSGEAQRQVALGVARLHQRADDQLAVGLGDPRRPHPDRPRHLQDAVLGQAGVEKALIRRAASRSASVRMRSSGSG